MVAATNIRFTTSTVHSVWRWHQVWRVPINASSADVITPTQSRARFADDKTHHSCSSPKEWSSITRWSSKCVVCLGLHNSVYSRRIPFVTVHSHWLGSPSCTLRLTNFVKCCTHTTFLLLWSPMHNSRSSWKCCNRSYSFTCPLTPLHHSS